VLDGTNASVPKVAQAAKTTKLLIVVVVVFMIDFVVLVADA
jgi:hypothetical protein